ncbi:STAS/SEC14 domain-containing protein [Methylocaldum sp. BRCS4]|jgi:hypothetical protein|uniref:STAS/SEC14 domain-containing protein n=1 Tax=Methylocaldum sp. TaxID=1969727 RepID=UPI0012EBE158|nr:STAS/SEC14 domain-containing protein [Methylocaldum sp. BRCS4]
MITQVETGSPNILAFRLRGKLHDEDYRTFLPGVDAAVAAAQGKLRLLAQFEDFHGWDVQAAWEDFKFGVRHYADFDRIAFVGERRWQKWMAVICKPFTKAEVKYFDASEIETAWAWVREAS